MKKRLLAALLCLGLTVGLLPVTASAYADVTRADGLAAALGNATASGNTVTLNNDVTLTDTINITAGTITLDFAGHTITGKAGKDGGYGVSSPGSSAIAVSGTANLTFRGSGGITGGRGGMGSNGMGADRDGDGLIDGGQADNGCNGGSALVVSGGTVTIEGGSFTGGSGGSGGVVKKELSKENDKAGDGGAGGSALSINSGTVNVSGGSFTGGSGGGGGTFDDGRSYNLGSSGPAGKAFAAAPVILNDSIVLVCVDTNTPTAVWNGTDALTGFQSVTVVPDHDLTVIGGTLGTDYTYSNGVLTITKAGTYIIGMKQGVATTSHRIVVNTANAADAVTLNLNGVNIAAPEEQSALTITQGSVTLNAVAASALQGGDGAPGSSGSPGIEGSIAFAGGVLNIAGGQGGDNLEPPHVGGSGGAGVAGSVSIAGGTLSVIGGRGGHTDGGLAGSGGTGVSESVTVTDGSLTATGGGTGIGIQASSVGKGVGGTVTAVSSLAIKAGDSAGSALTVLTSPATTNKQYVSVLPNTAVAFTGLTANGSATASTTALTLTFDNDVAGLTIGDITVTGATKVALTKESGTGVYTLTISSITVADGGTVNVEVAKTGFTFTPTNKDVTVRKYTPPAFVPVTSITRSFANTVATNTDLPLAGTVVPNDATNQTIVWSVSPNDASTTGAAVDSSGVFTATTAGTATVRATIANGLTGSTDYTQDFDILVSDTPITTYYVSVMNGTGGGSYAENDPVTIIANEPEANKRFKAWTLYPNVVFTSGGLTSPTATFTMPEEDVYARADYEDIPATYTVTYDPNGGSGTMTNGTATQGAAFTLPACTFTAPAGQQFKQWAIGSTSGAKVAAGSNYTFTANTTVYAVWENQTPTPTHLLMVVDGTGSGNYAEGTPVPITANAPQAGMRFDTWVIASGGGTLADPLSESTTYTMPGNDATVVATYRSMLEITAQPADQYVVVGQRATFSVAATGDGLTYQWYINRNDGRGWRKLKDSIGAAHVTTPVELDNDGYRYYCHIKDAYGNEIDSGIATLYVTKTPVLPETGDSARPVLWLSLLMLGGIGLFMTLRRWRRV